MNNEQLMSALRTVLQIGGTILAAKYGLDSATVASVTNEILTFASAAVVLGSTAWGLYARRDHGLIASAAAVPSVQTITTTKASTAEAIPSPKVVAAAGA